MKKLAKETKFAHLGKPGSAFSKGFQRRLDKVIKVVDLKDKKILDMGCGEGVWLDMFKEFTEPENIFGFDIDNEGINKFLELEKSESSKIPPNNLKICKAEKLDFESEIFDIIFSNEVIEHVEDDLKTLEESFRVLKKGGKIIIFTPNSGWPFETHGVFLRGKYYWGNIPFLPWMPMFIRKKLSPHVRNYSNGAIKRVLRHSGFKIVYHMHVFPGFDGAVKRLGIIGKFIKGFFHIIEKTPLHFFGISHFIIGEKE